jgi:hypothetical protein
MTVPIAFPGPELQLPAAEPGRLACTTQSAMDNQRLMLSFSGSGEIGDQEPLTAFLKQVHAFALEKKSERVTISFEQLQFMNSSCFKGFVTWFALLAAIKPPASRYQVHFMMNPSRRWQRASVSALACFAPEIVSFE